MGFVLNISEHLLDENSYLQKKCVLSLLNKNLSEVGMSTRFIVTLLVAFVALTFSLGLVLYVSHGDLWNWFWNIWIPAFMIVAGLDWSLVIYIGWDYLNPKESRLPIYLALGASLLIGLFYKAIVILIKGM